MRRGRRLFGGVFLLVAGIVSYGILRLPAWIEDAVKGVSAGQAVSVEALRIEHIGFRGVVFGEALATFTAGSVSWEGADIGYSWSSLKRAKVDSVDIEGLEIAWQGWPGRQIEEPIPAPGATAADAAAPVPEGTAAEGTEGPIGMEGAMADFSEEKRRHWRSLIPFQQLQIRNGRFLLAGNDRPATRIEFAVQARVESDCLETDLAIGDGLFEMQANATFGPIPREGKWVSTGLLDAGKAFDLWATVDPDAVAASGLTAVACGRPIRFDILSESFTGEPSRWSMAVEAEDLRLEAARLGEVHVRQAALAGWGVGGARHLRLGVSVDRWQRGPFTLGSGRAELTFEGQRWVVQSEAFAGELGSLVVAVALRGAGQSDLFAETGKGQMEVAFSRMEGPLAALEPFSIMLKKEGKTWQAEASPLSLGSRSGLALRQARLQWQEDRGTGSGGAEVFGSGGQALGNVAVTLESAPDGTLMGQVSLVDAGAPDRLRITGQLGKEAWDLAFEGVLPATWLKAIPDTLGWAAWQVEGEPKVAVEAVLRSGTLLSGEGQIAVEALSLRSGDRLAVRDASGLIAYRVLGWPATDGLQKLIVGSIQIGPLELSAIEVLWALPTLQQLRIERIEGRLQGGQFRVDPFAVSPRQPRFSATVRAEGIPVQLFFDLLDETRFRVEGTVSGEMLSGWDASAILLGAGTFALDSGGEPARFLFQDGAFLERTVSSLGVPDAVRIPLQEALLQEGIDIEALTLSLRPSEDRAQLTVRLELAGNCANAAIQVPIRGIVIEQRFSAKDLARLFGLQAGRSMRLISTPVED